jgi:hypothetical protein
MDTSEIFWLPFKKLYQELQQANRSNLSSLNELLNWNYSWLLDGLSRFAGPNEKSAAVVQGGGSHRALAYGPKRGISIDKHLADATTELSQLLVRLYMHECLIVWIQHRRQS